MQVEEITVPENIKRIGRAAFHRCPKLKRIEIRGNVGIIKEFTFSTLASLQEIEFGAGVRELQSGMCFKCFKIKKVILNSRQTKIGTTAIPLGVKIVYKNC